MPGQMQWEIYAVHQEGGPRWTYMLVHPSRGPLLVARESFPSSGDCHREIAKLPGYMKSAKRVVVGS